MTILHVVYIIYILQIKHFVVDFLWQPEYEWRNKGTFLHFGGIRHSLKHALTTAVILFLFSVSFSVICMAVVFEFVAHYFIDYGKMNINKMTGWDANKNPEFWYLLGLDQFLHQVCYLFIVSMIV
ncbi:MAG: DUF3307 domain-containing protein [Legionella sp.]|uniref:DUF3307 domain-containing protein n=1 Tax=Legionella sp. TaxID=459 RepID=UPI00284F1318|nr:DUF3307 domain-containing protein [Legionella sp.]